MSAMGIVSCVVRFICHIPSAMVGSSALTAYNKAKHLGDIYDVIPHGHAFLNGLRTVGITGWTTFAWNFVMFAVSVGASGVGLVIIGLVDLGISIALVSGLVKQALFMPKTYSACHHAADWRNGTDGRNFFLVANASHSFDNYDKPSSICHAMVEGWALAIAVTTMYLLVALFNLLFGCIETDAYDGISDSWLCLPCIWVVMPFHYLLTHVFPWIRFSRRYIARLFRRRKNYAPIPEKKPKSTPRTWREKIIPITKVTVLPPEVVTEVSKHLHHSDLVNLSRASKELRIRFFGYGDHTVRLDDVRQASCEGINKTSCQVCGCQVCKGCTSSVNGIAVSNTQMHISQCRPWCSTCFYTYISKNSWSNRGKHNSWCSINLTPWRAQQARDTTLESVCRTCAAKTPKEIGEILERDARFEVQRLSKQPLVCDSCKDVLSTSGPRWWICKECNIECRSHVHPAWASSY